MAANAAPQGWQVRIMFDELLDPNVEDIEEVMQNGVLTRFGTLARTQPVTLQCEDRAGAFVDVPYDGYYSPSGNSVTWPVGPSLVIVPIAPGTISVASECRVALKDSVVDKDGTSVPDEQRAPGPERAYRFKIAPIEVVSTSPANKGTALPEVGGVQLVFNTELDVASVTAADFTFSDAVDAAGAENVDGDPTKFKATGNLVDGKSYTFKVNEKAEFTDACGKVLPMPAPSVAAHTEVAFKTAALNFVTIAPFGGEGIAPGRKIKIDFNQKMDPLTLGADEFTLKAFKNGAEVVPALQVPPTIRSDFNEDTSVFLVDGLFNVDTEYTLTLNAGAKVTTAFGAKEFMVKDAVTAKFKTAPKIELAASSPANGAKIGGKADGGTGIVKLTFNQEMKPESFVPTEDFTFIDDRNGQPLTVNVELDKGNPQVVTFTTPDPDGDPMVGNSAGFLPNGSYTFTLNENAKVTDKILPTANEFVQLGGKREIKFTIEPAAAGPKCLGL